jgi:hypothetical protein
MQRLFTVLQRSLAGTAMVIATSMAANAFATTIAWSGSGASGTDPFGQHWLLKSDGWGIPGIAEGNIPWAGPQPLVKFAIEFSGLPAATVLDTDTDINGTVFRISPFSPIPAFDWDRQLGTKSVSFTPPPALGPLTQGRNFFVNIGINGAFSIPAVSFNAVYTLVPEPTAVVSVVIAVFAAVCIRRR